MGKVMNCKERSILDLGTVTLRQGWAGAKVMFSNETI
jgi:hypothetical protein